MKEESDNEKFPGGVELVCSTGFHHSHRIIWQKCDKKYATKKTNTGTEIGILSLKC